MIHPWLLMIAQNIQTGNLSPVSELSQLLLWVEYVTPFQFTTARNLFINKASFLLGNRPGSFCVEIYLYELIKYVSGCSGLIYSKIENQDEDVR
jgi:hypothetical protein